MMRNVRNIIVMSTAFILMLIGCVEPLEIPIPEPESLIIVEGLISDQDEPYEVAIYRAVPITTDSIIRPPLENATVRLYDNDQNIEDFTEVSPGRYRTGGAIRGKIGKSYHIRIELEDGTIIESQPDELTPVGAITEMRFEFEERIEEFGGNELKGGVFDIAVDSEAAPNGSGFTRWRYEGTFRVNTNPELRVITRPWWDIPLMRPRPCSGYTVGPAPGGQGTILVRQGDCTCCECYVNLFEEAPQVADQILIEDNKFNDISVAEIPVNNIYFSDRFMVEVEQMSLTQTAYDFFRIARIQKTEASNIFQPPSGELVGNVFSENSNVRVVGLFWSTSISKDRLFIGREDVPFNLTPMERIPESCLLFFENSSTEKPAQWRD